MYWKFMKDTRRKIKKEFKQNRFSIMRVLRGISYKLEESIIQVIYTVTYWKIRCKND